MRILIAEPKWTGHHLFFAQAIANGLQGFGHDVIFAVTDSKDESARSMIALAVEGLNKGVEVRRTLHGLPRGFAHLGDKDGSVEVATIAEEVRRLRPDRLIVPSADALAFHLGRRGFRDFPIESRASHFILHNAYVGYHGHGLRFAVKRQLIQRRLLRLDGNFGAFDHRIAGALGPRHQVMILPVPPQPYEATTSTEARRRLGIDLDALIFLAAGEHSQRKGTDRLIEAWPAKRVQNEVLLIVGRCSEEVRAALQQRPRDIDSGRIRVLDQVVDSQTYMDSFQACDVTTACYPRHFGCSGILTNSATVGRPLLGSDYGYIGDCIRSFGLGATVDCMNPEALAASLACHVRNPPVLDEQRARPFSEFHTDENHRRIIQSWVIGETADGIEPTPAPPLNSMR